MIKNLFILLITFYQKAISPLFHQLVGVQNACRYPVTCSEFAKAAIEKQGAVKGLLLTCKRLLSCQPYIKIV